MEYRYSPVGQCHLDLHSLPVPQVLLEPEDTYELCLMSFRKLGHTEQNLSLLIADNENVSSWQAQAILGQPPSAGILKDVAYSSRHVSLQYK